MACAGHVDNNAFSLNVNAGGGRELSGCADFTDFEFFAD